MFTQAIDAKKPKVWQPALRRRAAHPPAHDNALAHAPRAPVCACGGTCPRCALRSTPVNAGIAAPKPQADTTADANKPALENASSEHTALVVGAEQDPSEREADAAAAAVLAGGDARVSAKKRSDVQRAASAGGTASMGSISTKVGKAVEHPGQPLEPALREEMSERFGADFSDVRVHLGATADQSARDLHADAYTLGRDVVFANGKYEPGSSGGRRLIAHELAHVAQQSEGVIRRWPSCNPARLSAEDCPAREQGEATRARNGDMVFFSELKDPGTGQTGSLIANFDIGSSRIKKNLKQTIYWKQFLQLIAKEGSRWKLIGFSDCAESGGDHPELRLARANAVFNTLPESIRGQIDSVEAAASHDCMTGNDNAADRAMNRSVAFVLNFSIADFNDDLDEDITVEVYNPQKVQRDCQNGGHVKTFPFRTTRFGGAPIMAHRSGDMVVVKLPMHVKHNGDFDREVDTLPDDTFLDGTELRKDEIVRVRHFELKHWYNFNITGDASDDKKTDYCVTGEAMLKFAEATNKAFLVNFATTGVEAMTLGTPAGKLAATGVAKVAAPAVTASKTFAQKTILGGMLGMREVAPTALAGVSSRAPISLVEGKIAEQAVTRSIGSVAAPAADVVAPSLVRSVPSVAASLPTQSMIGGASIIGSTHLAGDEVFGQLSSELGMSTAATPAGDAAAAALDANSGGLVGTQGAPGTVDLALQTHGNASAVRGAYGVTGGQMQSAHIGPTSFLRDVFGYSRNAALTVLMDPAMHRAFDAYWKNWAMAQRRAGFTQCTVGDLERVMLDAIEQIPLLPQRTRNTLAWRLQLEINELGLPRTATINLPYANIGRAAP